MEVSIIILSYNTQELLKACLESLFTVLTHTNYEVIVVDNASTDGSVAMLKKQFPKVHLIESKENVGFGKGINLGVEQAKGEYVLFFNSDATLKTDLESLLDFMKDHPDVGIVGGKMENSDGSFQRSYGNFYNLKDVFLMLFSGDAGEVRRFTSAQPISVDWVSVGFMMVRKTVFTQLEGFDPQFFMYIEDMELCYRVKKNHNLVYFYPEAVASHIGQGSSNRTFAIIHIYKGLLYFYQKHKSQFAYIIVKMMLILKAMMAISIGMVKRDHYLVSTYKKALQF